MRLAAFMLVFLLFGSAIHGQTLHLKPFRRGMKIMNEDVPMDTIIHEIMFQDGMDDTVSVVRFDNVGRGLYPLIISSKLPIRTDSLGLLSFNLQADTLENFLWLIDNTMLRFHNRNFDRVLIRVTYRYHGHIKQYYVTNAKITTGYLLNVEKQLVSNGNSNALKTFYKFVSGTGLIKSVRGKIVWVEAP